ncbi:MAG TPA: MFS transporter [Anaerolineales bacterium]|nr:MFS transporter [Anaerolineales bacterium]
MTGPTAPSRRPSGMTGLMIVLAGQAISILASNMTSFALSIWVFQKTSSATDLGVMQSAFTVPYLLLIPLAGVFVDRYNRKLMMMVSDLTAALGTLSIFILFATHQLEIWHFFIINGFIGLGSAFQWPAYSAAITTMIPKEQYGRANGMMSLVQAGPSAIAPLLAGALMPHIGLTGVMIIDLSTFLLAIGALMLIRVPPPRQTVEGQAGKGNIFKEATFGFKYIFQRPSLFGIVIILFAANLFLGFPNSVQVPLVLSRTGNNSVILGAVETAGAVSWVLGSLIMSAWGGLKNRIHGTLVGWSFFCLVGNILFGLGRGLGVWIPTSLLCGLGATLGNASSQSLLQAKVAPDVQGRVFAARRLLTWAPDMFTPILGGLLADHLLEPAMQSGTGLARAFGWMAGTGRGSGMAVEMIVFGGLTITALLAGYAFPAIRQVERLLPDHDQLPGAADTRPD